MIIKFVYSNEMSTELFDKINKKFNEKIFF